MACCFCGDEIHVEDAPVDVAACHTCLRARSLLGSGEGLIQYIADHPDDACFMQDTDG